MFGMFKRRSIEDLQREKKQWEEKLAAQREVVKYHKERENLELELEQRRTEFKTMRKETSNRFIDKVKIIPAIKGAFQKVGSASVQTVEANSPKKDQPGSWVLGKPSKKGGGIW